MKPRNRSGKLGSSSSSCWNRSDWNVSSRSTIAFRSGEKAVLLRSIEPHVIDPAVRNLRCLDCEGCRLHGDERDACRGSDRTDQPPRRHGDRQHETPHTGVDQAMLTMRGPVDGAAVEYSVGPEKETALNPGGHAEPEHHRQAGVAHAGRRQQEHGADRHRRRQRRRHEQTRKELPQRRVELGGIPAIDLRGCEHQDGRGQKDRRGRQRRRQPTALRGHCHAAAGQTGVPRRPGSRQSGVRVPYTMVIIDNEDVPGERLLLERKS